MATGRGRPNKPPEPGSVGFDGATALHAVREHHLEPKYRITPLSEQAGIDGRRLDRYSRGEMVLSTQEFDRLVTLDLWSDEERRTLKVG